MTVLRGTLRPEGALVDVLVGWSASAARAQRLALRPVPPPLPLQALIDTGAEVSCVEPAAIASLGLPLAGFTPANVPAAGGLTFGVQRDAGLTILHPSGSARRHLVLSDVLLLELPLGTLGYQALIGRDVLAGCKFLYDGRGGAFRLAY